MKSEKIVNDAELEHQGNIINNLFGSDKAVIEKISKVNVENAWGKIRNKRQSAGIFKTIQITFKYAAAIFVFLLAGYYFASYRINLVDQDTYTVFTILNSEMGNVVLPDGTRVKLNSSSELKFPVQFVNSREVFLSGEAYFDVKSNPDNPFLVHIDDFTIKVTGTRFNVKSYPDSNSETTLEEGKITIINNEGRSLVDLKPNETLVFDKAQMRILVSVVDSKLKTDWTEGKISFKDQTIGEIARVIERWYNVKVVFDDLSIKQVRLTGTILKNKPVEQILNVLIKSERIDFEQSSNETDGSSIIHLKYRI